ncbi:efflux RND transporter periplasmic adaptor subunit [Sporomusa acidovorans]|uniref:Macrolide export protein MacA n=1 Tax=Sporomusa acidovorans (strain ATCC 49682 / DSM 3132 / Mol) TaxID=1123286 RepID=A0ABZ3J4G1_SPOA4|nr:efflux RND transporter periplasmic adaptor subunit [Sporomusa acidovorans]OZC16382.1 macrolide export protein MacA [Sporomusa acidovorans DSM 3132]SDF00430.1 RND family efflux transporter, MFP subunit [Sporomusa acidovorans]
MQKLQIPTKFRPAILLIIMILVVGLFIVSHNGFGFVQGFSPKTVSVTTAPVSMINKPVDIIVPGSVQSRQAVIVSAEIAGKISELNIAEGQTVNAGQLLVHIEGSGGQTIAESPISPTLGQSGDSQQQAQANYDKILKEYERYEKLYQVGGIARKQFENVAARLQAARQALDSAAGTEETASAGSAISTPARQPGFANITAPISGKVTGLAAAAGNTVQAGQRLMVLDTGGELRVAIHLDQKDLYLIQTGTQAEIVGDDSPNQPVIGQVEAIYPEVGTGTPTFLAHIRLENNNGLLKQDIPVKVHLKTGQTIPAYAVPTAALFQDQAVNYVYLAVDGKIMRQQVDVGITLDNLTEITSPLPEQAVIVTSGINNVKDGDTLSIQ